MDHVELATNALATLSLDASLEQKLIQWFADNTGVRNFIQMFPKTEWGELPVKLRLGE